MLILRPPTHLLTSLNLIIFFKVFFFLHYFPGPGFTNHSQEQFLSFFSKIYKLKRNTTSDWLNRMVYKSCYIQMLLNIEKKNLNKRAKTILNQSVEDAGVAFVKGANKRNEFF